MPPFSRDTPLPRMAPPPRTVLFRLLAASAACLLICAVAAWAADDGLFSGRRDVRGLVRQDMAELAARTAAELAAYEQGARRLAQEPDLRFLTAPPAANDVASAGQPMLLSLDGLARMLFVLEESAVRAEGFPPHVQMVVHLRLVSPKDLRQALRRALVRPDLVELYAQVLAGKRILLDRYDRLAAEIMLLLPNADSRGQNEILLHLHSVINEIKAMDIYAAQLRMYDRSWQNPGDNNMQLQKAHALAPQNPLILTALAEVLLQLDRPVQAMDHIGKALAIAPDIARAHDVKGIILLRQSLPGLAAQSFGKAIDLSPQNPAYLLHRGTAYLLLEEEAAMCADFSKACAFGHCDELRQARDNRRCLDGAARQSTDAPRTPQAAQQPAPEE